MSDIRDTDASGAGATIVQVVEDARAYASAQVDLYKTMAGVRLRVAKAGLVFGVLAAFIAGSAITALLVGAILALSAPLGPWGATALVVILALALAGLMGWLAGARLARAFGDLG